MTALADSTAGADPYDPGVVGTKRAIGLLEGAWRADLTQAVRLPATDPAGLHHKAQLLSALTDLVDDERADPALRLAASLAEDVQLQSGRLPV